MNKYFVGCCCFLFVFALHIYQSEVFYAYIPENASYITFVTQRNRAEKSKKLYDKIESLEDTLHPYKDILSNNKYDELLNELLLVCSQWTKEAGETAYNEMIEIVRAQEKPSEQTLWARILLTSEQFLKVQKERYELESLDMDTYCTKKYANLLYQKRLSEVHRNHLNNSQIEGKNKILETNNMLQYISNRDKRNVHEDFQIDIKHINPLSKERENTDIFVNITNSKIEKNLFFLKEHWILTEQEVNDISWKIEFITTTWCNFGVSAYIFSQLEQNKDLFLPYSSDRKKTPTLTNKNEIWTTIMVKDGQEINFHWLRFIVPTCLEYNAIIRFSELFDYIIIHEIGHYYAHWVDSNDKAFSDMCRKKLNSWSEMIVCTYDKFITEYGKSSSHEDYAESFASVVFEKLYWFSPFWKLTEEKKEYFLKKFDTPK